MNCMQKLFPETAFGGYSNLDGTVAFFLRVRALTRPSDVVLDVGCGRGAYQEDPVETRRDLHILRGRVQKVIGLDVDKQAVGNPFVDEFRLLEEPSSAWPVEDASVDIVITDWTLEHVQDPDLFFGEACRVLKPNGYFCARTTNAWGYVVWMARLIPRKYHMAIIQKVQKKREEEDVFPAHYACNSVPLLRRKLKEHGLAGTVFGFAGLPGYLDFSCAAYYLGYLYERFAPHYLRQSLVIFARKGAVGLD